MRAATVEQQAADLLGTTWCPTCRKPQPVLEHHEEQGDPDHHGACPMYAVADLACGHQAEHRIPGATSWVI